MATKVERDNSNALVEQAELVEAIGADTLIVEIRSSSPLGATLLAFNQTARKHGRKELGSQEWAELAVATGLLAIKRTWEYSAKTQNNKGFVEEMRVIAKLFTVPAPDHTEYGKRMFARFEAEQACRAKFGIQ